MFRIAVSGAAGKMGKSNIQVITGDMDCQLTGALEWSGCPFIGRDAGEIAGLGKALNTVITASTDEAMKNSDVLIDFSSADATEDHLKDCLRLKKALVIGTTGLSDSQKKAIQEAGKEIPVIWAPNYSIGVNLIAKLSRIAAETLGTEFDVEIVEAHHRMKKDSPSGTAIQLLEVVKKALNTSDIIYGRHGMVGERPTAQIGMHAVRGGDVVGDHTVGFYGLGERVEITHKASSRETFSRGALKAAKYILSKGKGFYTFNQVLGF